MSGRESTGRGLLSQLVIVVGTAILIVVLGAGAEPARPLAAEDVPTEWLEERSMLHQAAQAARKVSGGKLQWQNQYGDPQPERAVKRASVWLLDYPGSVIPGPGQSVIGTWGNPELWKALEEIGIDLLHTGPLSRAGGIEGREYTPTRDGWFDRISLELDPDLGTEEEYARMVKMARRHDALIAGDLVPLHTGLGPDFHLALRGHRDYPGMYTMVEIPREHWGLLPEVKGPWEVALVSKEAARKLTRLGLLPGLINSNDAAEEAKSWSGWSASGAVKGVDGTRRRWVYLHYFKPSQPTFNWLDPSFAAQRAVAGDAVRTIVMRGTKVVRLDAVPFLGLEPKPDDTTTEHFQHPLSVTGTRLLANLVRKLGGWSFQELNVPLESLQKFTRHGPDLSYDFVTRAQILQALLTEDAGPLRLAFRWLLEAEVQPIGLVHDLQNHDEITYQLVELKHRKDDRLEVGGETLTGEELYQRMLKRMRSRVAGAAAPYNRLYRPERDGLATTFAGFIAPALGIRDPYRAGAEEVALIRRGHLLLAAANALQPGAFGLSSWDLVGALPIPEEGLKEWIGAGDYRWINRGGVDLMDSNPKATGSAFGLARAKALYGPLPEQLKDPESFVCRLRHMLAARREARVAEGELLAVPEPRSAGVCLLVLRLPEHPLAVTVLNFGREEVSEEVDLSGVEGVSWDRLAGHEWVDILGGKAGGERAGSRLKLRVPALTGTTFVLRGKNR